MHPGPMHGIVVGVDGSEFSTRALQWAHAEAHLHDWPLTAVLAWGHLDQHHADPDQGFDPAYTSHDARVALEAYVERALGPELATSVRQRIVCDLPARALLENAATASLLVVGARGRGGFKGLLLGSVSLQLLHHAPCPIAVLRPSRDPSEESDTMERIICGIDGSETAHNALRWAVEEARLRGATLEVVHAWQVPYVGGYPYVPAFDPGDFEETARATVAAALEDIDVSGLAHPVEQLVPMDGAAQAILAAAKGADLVVLGSRGRGGFKGLLLGSVNQQVTQHAECPVVIVPPAS